MYCDRYMPPEMVGSGERPSVQCATLSSIKAAITDHFNTCNGDARQAIECADRVHWDVGGLSELGKYPVFDDQLRYIDAEIIALRKRLRQLYVIRETLER